LINLSVFTPTVERCGIAQYSSRINRQLGDRFRITVVPAEEAITELSYQQLGARMNQADIGHVHYENGFFTANEKLEGNSKTFFDAIKIPLVCSFHCLPFFELADWENRVTQPHFHSILHSQHHICRMAALTPDANLSNVLLPVYKMPMNQHLVSSVRRRYNLNGARLISISGFIKSHKGYDLAINALSKLPKDVRLLIVGAAQNKTDQIYVEKLQQQIISQNVSDRVIFTGYLDTPWLNACLAASSVVLAPFTSMTASASLADAFTAGAPVLASNLPQCEELSQRFGGMQLFECGKLDDLVLKLGDLLRNHSLRDRLASETRQHREQCGIAATADRIARVLNNVYTGAEHVT
jgi:glycosyltransferase involved in cell wall biosynthesis